MRASLDRVLAGLSSVVVTADLVVLVSPHGNATGVYERARGSLGGFGLSEVEAERPTDDDAVRTLAAAWNRPVLGGPADHGVVVPLLVAPLGSAPVVACAFGETTGPTARGVGDALEEAKRFSEALASLAGRNDRRVALVASAHGAAALGQKAPLGDRPEAAELEAALLHALESEVEQLASIPAGLWERAGSCGAGPLAAFGRALSGSPASLLAHEAPAGVGYIVAVAGTLA